jgi:hypothetical protein
MGVGSQLVVAGTRRGIQPHPGHPPPMLSLGGIRQRQVCLRAGTLGELCQSPK